MVDIANERGVMNTSVAVVPPRFRRTPQSGVFVRRAAYIMWFSRVSEMGALNAPRD